MVLGSATIAAYGPSKVDDICIIKFDAYGNAITTIHLHVVFLSKLARKIRGRPSIGFVACHNGGKVLPTTYPLLPCFYLKEVGESE